MLIVVFQHPNKNEDRQLDSIASLEIPQGQVFVDKVSGKTFERSAWKETETKRSRKNE